MRVDGNVPRERARRDCTRGDERQDRSEGGIRDVAHHGERFPIGRPVRGFDLFENLGAGDVRRHQIRRELDSLEVEMQDVGERRLGGPEPDDQPACSNARPVCRVEHRINHGHKFSRGKIVHQQLVERVLTLVVAAGQLERVADEGDPFATIPELDMYNPDADAFFVAVARMVDPEGAAPYSAPERARAGKGDGGDR